MCSRQGSTQCDTKPQMDHMDPVTSLTETTLAMAMLAQEVSLGFNYLITIQPEH